MDPDVDSRRFEDCIYPKMLQQDSNNPKIQVHHVPLRSVVGDCRVLVFELALY